MLAPKKVKWRKQQKGRMRGKAIRGGSLFFGEFGLQATECGRITSKQIEAARVAMTRYVKRGGKIWIRVFPDKPVTKKPAETRMGSGKGNVEEWVVVIKPGRIIFEMEGISQAEAFEALRLASHKFPVQCKAINRAYEAEAKGRAALVLKQKHERQAARAEAIASKAGQKVAN